VDKENSKKHWEKVYTQKNPNEVSWFQNEPTVSKKIIQSVSNNLASVIDVGGGASLLVDYLIKLGYTNVAVLDISDKAIQYAKARLGDQANSVEWFVEDITQFTPPHTYNVWHDRAVFHFLIDEQSRKSYVEVLRNAIMVGGYVIIATFAKDGPKKCSGLDIVQYDENSIQYELGNDFVLLDSEYETHITPNKAEQHFIYFTFQRT